MLVALTPFSEQHVVDVLFDGQTLVHVHLSHGPEGQHGQHRLRKEAVEMFKHGRWSTLPTRYGKKRRDGTPQFW